MTWRKEAVEGRSRRGSGGGVQPCGGGAVEEGREEMGGVRMAAQTEVGRNDDGHIVEDVQELLDGLVLEEKEKEEKGMEETEAEEVEEIGVETEKDGEGDMEVEETLKEAEKSADEVEWVEKDVMEE